MIAYKLLRKHRDGTLHPLFIDRNRAIPVGEWMPAENKPTKGYALRPGWHCTLTPNAPHLSEAGRVWAKVEVEGFEFHQRPQSQGGTWVLARMMKVLEVFA